MLVKDYMTRHPLMVQPTMSIVEAQHFMGENNIRHLPIVGHGKSLLGLVTRQRLLVDPGRLGSLNVWEITRYLSGLTVKDAMIKGKDVVTIDQNATVEEAARLMVKKRIGCLPVLAEGIVVGIITETDLLAQLTNLPYGTPAMTCWVPGEDEAAQRLGVVRYLVKPITRDTLLTALGELGEDVETVLLVDDEPEVLQLFARMLSSAGQGYRVLRAKSGQRALSLLHERRPDVVLLDLIMPGMDGFEVLWEKSQDPVARETPVITISSRDPSGEPIVSDTLTVSRGGGLSVPNLLTCIRAVSDVLVPLSRSADQERQETPVA